jgi:hypothetical protein
MPDLPLFGAGPSEAASNAAASTGITLTAHASANTEGAWTELIASTAYDAQWAMVTFVENSGANRHHTDIGIGAALSEVVLIPDLYSFGWSDTRAVNRAFLMPLRVPRGTRLAARTQASVGGATIKVVVNLFGGGVAGGPGLNRVEAIGVAGTTLGTAIDPGATPHTDVVVELTAASGFAYQWMCLSLNNTADSTWAATESFLIDVMKGAASSEVVVVPDLCVSGGTISDAPFPAALSFPCAIPAGERVSLRVRSSVGTASDRILNVIGYGVG